MRRLATAIVMTSLIAPLTASAAPLVIRAARVLDGRGRIYRDAAVVVDGDRTEYRVREGGQDPMQAIISATSLAAESLGLGEKVGTIAPGYLADPIAVDGDPLKNIAAFERVTFVMKGGAVLRSITGAQASRLQPPAVPAGGCVTFLPSELRVGFRRGGTPRRCRRDACAPGVEFAAMQQVKIGILGSGDVGKSFARAFVAVGHDVMIGSRSPEKLADFASDLGGKAQSGTFEQTASFGDIVVLATLGTATDEALRLAGERNFAGKVVIDATNPLDFSGGMPPKLFVGHTDSLGESIQRQVPNAKVVKAFNTVGNAFFYKPQLPGGPPDMFIAGNDAGAKKIVSQICDAFGWGVIDLGGLESSRYLEPMCMVWVLHGALSGSWTHAFKMLHA